MSSMPCASWGFIPRRNLSGTPYDGISQARQSTQFLTTYSLDPTVVSGCLYGGFRIVSASTPTVISGCLYGGFRIDSTSCSRHSRCTDWVGVALDSSPGKGTV